MPKKKDMPVREQVNVDLQAAGVPLKKDMELISRNQEIFHNPETDNKVRSEIVEDLVTIISADIKKIETARKTDPTIRENESNPEYKKAMDELLKGLRAGLNDLTTAQFGYGKVASKSEFLKEHKKA